VVDKLEFIAGVGLLVGVSRCRDATNIRKSSSDEMKFLFSLFDLNGDGNITLKEMASYFSSMFNVINDLFVSF